MKYLAKEGHISIALPLKQNFNQKQLKEEDFHKVGVLFQVESIEKTEKGYKLTIKVLERIEIKGFTIRK